MSIVLHIVVTEIKSVKSVKNLNSNTTSLELMVSSYPTSILLVITEIKSKVLK